MRFVENAALDYRIAGNFYVRLLNFLFLRLKWVNQTSIVRVLTKDALVGDLPILPSQNYFGPQYSRTAMKLKNFTDIHYGMLDITK